MNDHDLVKGLGRFPANLNNIFFMINLLLPGTSVIYYGDEIGMSNSTKLTWSQIQDPYTKTYCNETNFDDCICRDQSRTPMQWTAGPKAGFTNSSEPPWLPIGANYEQYNVEHQNNTYLASLRNITKIRKWPAFESGKVFFPYHDKEIFSFLR